MKYQGPLYGKVGNKYILLTETAEDFDALSEEVEDLKVEVKAQKLYGLLRQRHLAKRVLRVFGHIGKNAAPDIIRLIDHCKKIVE